MNKKLPGTTHLNFYNLFKKHFGHFVFLFVLVLGISSTAKAQFGASPWNAPSGTYTVPAGVTQITVTCYGGGGAGGGASATDRNGGGGGGGACVTVTNYPVTPGGQITVAVGAGGTGVSAGTGNSGGASSVNVVGFPVFISAAGGAGGTRGASSSSAGVGGSGGLIANNIPINTGFNGGNGGNSDPNTTSLDRSGGGGGGGGTTAAGGNGGIVTAGTGGATGGGAGGAGQSTSTSAGANGVAGNAYGGGGGGSTVWSGANRAGAAGASGAVIITYVVVPCNAPTSITTSATPSSSCNASQSVTFNVASHSGGNLNGGSWEYQWQDGAAVVQAWSATSSYVTTLTSTKTFTVYMRSTACTGSPSAGFNATYTLNTIPAQPSAISGLTSPCSGSSQNYSVTDLGVTYTWSCPAGWVINSGQGTATINVTPSATAGNISVTPSNVCGSGTPRTLAVTPGAGPTVTVSPNPASACGGVGVVITASGSTNYTWAPATGLSATNIANPTANPGTTTTYTVTETTSGCNNTATVQVRVGGTVSTTAVASPTIVCPGGTVNLTSTPSEGAVTLFSDNFEGADTWTKAGNFAIGAPVAGNTVTTTYSGTKIMGTVLNGAYAINLTEAANYATSSTINCTGYNSISLSYRSFSRWENNCTYDWGKVYVSNNNGSTWTQIEQLCNDETAWSLHTVSIAAWADNMSQVKIKFTMKSDGGVNDTGWNIDDIVVTGVNASPSFSYAWTSTPAGFTSSLQNPTANPSVATTYNLTVTQTTSGCTGSNSTANVTMYPLPQGSLSGVTPMCSGNPASLTWTASAGTGPFTLNYNPSSQTNTGVVSGTPFNTQNNAATGANNYSLISVTDANGCVRSSGFTDGSETITGNASPTAPTCSNQSRCSAGTVTFTAGGAGAGEGYKWYNAATGGTLLFTGNPYTTASLSITTNFWVAKYQTGAPNCEGPRTQVTAIINVGGLDSYTTTRTTGITYSSIVGAGGIAVTSASGNWRNTNCTGMSCNLPYPEDDNLSNALPIGFNFPFGGENPSQFLVSTNGFITFNTATKAKGFDLAFCGTTEPYCDDNTKFSGSAGKAGTLQTIAPFYNDLVCADGAGGMKTNANTSVYYQTTGSAPNRVLTVEWKNMANDISCTDASCWETYGDLNFQVKIYETSGNIEFIYGPTMTQTTYSSCDPGESCTVENTYTSGINASTLDASPTLTELYTQQSPNSATFNSTPQNGLTTLPAANSKITITRTAPPGATSAPTCVGANMYPVSGSTNQCLNTTLSWTAGDQVPTGYDVYFSTNYTNVNTCNVAARVSANQPGEYYNPGALALLTTYYWKVIPKNGLGDLPCGSAATYTFTTGQGDVQPTQITCDIGTFTGSTANGFTSLGAPVITNSYDICNWQWGSGTLTAVGPILSEGSELTWGNPADMPIFCFDLGRCEHSLDVVSVWGCTNGLTQSPVMPSIFGIPFALSQCDGYYHFCTMTRGCNGNSACTEVRIRLLGNNNSAPTSLTSNPASPICSGTTITLTVSGGTMGAGANYQWYTGSCGGTLIATTTTNTLVVTPGATTTYYVRRTGGTGNCPNTTSCVSLAVTIATAPTATVANKVSCSGVTAITMGGAGFSYGGSISSAVWSGGAGLGTWNNNGTATIPTDDYFTPNASPGYGSFTATLTITPGCSGMSNIVLTALVTWATYSPGVFTTWNGSVSTDWFNPVNWCSIVPTSTIDALIPAGMPNMPAIAGAGAVCRTLTVTTGASVTTSTTNNLDVYGNWIKDGTYTPNSGTITFRGSVAQSVAGSSSNTFYNLVINNSSSTGVTLSQPAYVNGALTLTDGYLYSASATKLTLNSGSSSGTGSAGSFVDGPMTKIGDAAFTFPTGDDVAPAGFGPEDRFARIGFSDPGANITDAYTAEYFLSNATGAGFNTLTVTAPLTDVSPQEYWILDRTVAGTPNVTITLFTENAGSSGINNCPDLSVARWNGSSWEDKGQSAIVSTGCNTPTNQTLNITSASFNTFSPFTFGSKNGGVINPFPVDLLYFNAKCEDAKVTADWATASETNNDFFTLERSKDGTSFDFVRNIQGAGTSSSAKTYSAIDEEALAGTSFYRLTQTDFNGNKETFTPVAVTCPDDFDFDINVASSATDDGSIFISISGTPNENVILVFRDVLGNELYTKALVNSSGNISLNLDIREKLSSGIYFIIASSNDKYVIRKIIVK